MARAPLQQLPSIRSNWVHFFLGSPKRFLWTCFTVFLMLVVAAPNVAGALLAYVLTAVTRALGPAVGPLFEIGIVLWGFKIMFSPLRPKRGNKH